MKKNYEKPELRLALIQTKDIISVSGNQATVNGGDNIIDDPFNIDKI